MIQSLGPVIFIRDRLDHVTLEKLNQSCRGKFWKFFTHPTISKEVGIPLERRKYFLLEFGTSLGYLLGFGERKKGRVGTPPLFVSA